MWDLIVVGGGSAGVTAALSASRQGCKTLLIEKNSFLGGSSTASLVMPMMKNSLKSGENLTIGLYGEILQKLEKTGDSAVFSDGNAGWFNPEMMKCVLDDMCQEADVEILFDSTVIDSQLQKNNIYSVKIINRSITKELRAKYFIDATADANLAVLCGVPFESGENGENQTMSLRFNMANIDLEVFATTLEKIDPDSGVSPVYKMDNGDIMLSTAYTWDSNKEWKLKPYFEKGIEDKIITLEDSAYFQLFTIPGQKGAVTFNCPRIYADKHLDPLTVEDTSLALKQGRKQIRRIAEFCKKYLPGFENAYISQIAPQPGIRDSRRIKGKYELTEQDIAEGKKFDKSVAKSNYPVDIHSSKRNQSELTFSNENDFYEIPLESLIPMNIGNLLVVGRAISSTFKAQASLRIQPNCLAMGEAAGLYVSELIKKGE